MYAWVTPTNFLYDDREAPASSKKERSFSPPRWGHDKFEQSVVEEMEKERKKEAQELEQKLQQQQKQEQPKEEEPPKKVEEEEAVMHDV